MFPTTTKRKALEMKRDGHSFREIGRKLGASATTISRWVKTLPPLPQEDLPYEEVTPLWISDELRPPQKIYRQKRGSHRYYYTLGNEGPRFYLGVTSFISKYFPEDKAHLEKWMADFPGGYEAMREYVDETADYGSIMHGLIAQFVQFGMPMDDDAAMDEIITASLLFYKRNPDKYLPKWGGKLKKDILAFAQFVWDYQVTFLALEIGLVSKKRGIGGQIDFPCKMNAKDYTSGKTPIDKRRRVMAVGDAKSGRKGFFESHVNQLGCYKEIWEENYPEHPVHAVFNWSPKDWREKPSYNLKWQTPDYETIHVYSEVAEKKMRRSPGNRVIYTAPLVAGEDPSGCYQTLSAEEYVKSIHHGRDNS